MTKPEIRQIVEETRARSGRGDGEPEIWALFEATDEEETRTGSGGRRERSWRSPSSLARADAGRACCRASSCDSYGTSSRSAHRAASNRLAVGNSAEASRSEHHSLEPSAALS
jgi:hypothetical protein